MPLRDAELDPPSLDGRTAATSVATRNLASLRDWLPLQSRQIVRRRIGKGSYLIREDSEPTHFHLLVDGWAVKYKSLLDGHRHVIDFLLPDDHVSGLSMRAASCSVEALEDVEALSVPRHVFDGLLALHPAFAREMCLRFERSELRVQERLASIGYRCARMRICRLLLELAARSGLGRGPGEVAGIMMPVTQRHLADATALRGETVCRVLMQLRDEGVATLTRGLLHVADYAALASASEMGATKASGGQAFAVVVGAAPSGVTSGSSSIST